MSFSINPLPPAFVPTAIDTSEMFHAGRTINLVHHKRCGDLTVAAFTGGCYSSVKFTRAEALALAVELQRVLALPMEQAA